MCGISGIINLHQAPIESVNHKISVLNSLIEHRGPDGEGVWISPNQSVALGHRRLSILDLSAAASQPMMGQNNTVICFNGEIYNHIELRESLESSWPFRTDHSDTETILAAYAQYQQNCMTHLRGMFAFALWDEKNQTLFCARDRFGIKPFYYTIIKDTFIFASEAKALLPFLPKITTNHDALAEYLTFQYTLGEETLFTGIHQLLPGHALKIVNGKITIWKYWDVDYSINENQNESYFYDKLQELLEDSIRVHLRSDVKVASYISGGLDSSLMGILASHQQGGLSGAFHGRFTEYPGYDESGYASAVAEQTQQPFHCLDITAQDFTQNIKKVIYHLDFPCAGPGSFPQYMVSQLASQHVKVILGGQGGDELFGGYARYLVCYLEQALKHSIDPCSTPSLEIPLGSILSSLPLLQEYTPMIKGSWKNNLFGNLDERYFQISDRSADVINEINWENIPRAQVYPKFSQWFNSENVKSSGYFNKMLHFDLKCSLPALLQVEDRMSMAHGVESRVPLLDHHLVEFVATIPPHIKFKEGKMKFLLKEVFKHHIPEKIATRRDKMGFPVPLKEWFNGELKDYIYDVFTSSKARSRNLIHTENLLTNLPKMTQFSRKTWALLSMELWFQEFHDKEAHYHRLLS
jgi:asparagine synthase (glutamine-hydrolysing)